jgi:hypothetical protein
MYPPVIQFETRARELEADLERALAAPPAPKRRAAAGRRSARRLWLTGPREARAKA